MKPLAIILFTFAMAVSCATGPLISYRPNAESIRPSDRWIVTDDVGDVVVHIDYELRDGLTQRHTTMYLSQLSFENMGAGFVAASVVSEDGRGKDGKGAGANHSITLEPHGSYFLLKAWISWRGDGKSGHFEKEWQLPALSDLSIVDGPFRADIRIENKGPTRR